MEETAEFTIALSALVVQLTAAGTPAALRDALVQLCAAIATGDIAFQQQNGTLSGPADEYLPVELSAVMPLVESMERHGVTHIAVESVASARELLMMANLLAEPTGSHPSGIDQRIYELGCWHIRLQRAERPTDEAIAEPVSDNARSSVAGALACVTLDDARAAAYTLTTAFANALAADDAEAVSTLLFDVQRIERDSAALTDVSDDIHAMWKETLAEMTSPHALQLVARMLPGGAIPRTRIIAVLQHANDAGAAALLSRLSVEKERAERRALFDAIVDVRAGFSLLLRSLQHPMWFVVRNAVSLLGAMKVPDSETALTQALGHADERVRLAVITALTRLATPAACQGLGTAMHDKSATVRYRAFKSLRKLQGMAISAVALSEAIELERDESIQREMIDALLTSSSADVPQRLARLCSPSSRVTLSTATRIMLLETLARIRPTVAMPLLRMAAVDRDVQLKKRALALLAKAMTAATAPKPVTPPMSPTVAATAEPSAAEPSAAEPVAAEPASAEPTAADPVASDALTEPVTA